MVMVHIVSIPPPYPFNLIKSYLFSIISPVGEGLLFGWILLSLGDTGGVLLEPQMAGSLKGHNVKHLVRRKWHHM